MADRPRASASATRTEAAEAPTTKATKKAMKKKAPKKKAKKAPARPVKARATPPAAQPVDVARTTKLFLAAYGRNWDEGTHWFVRALRKPECDHGTALLIYWLASPAYYAKYTSLEEVPRYERPALDLVRTIEARVQAGDLPEVIAYAPPADAARAAQGLVPEAMTRPSAGAIDGNALIEGGAIEKQVLAACSAGDVEALRALVGRFDPNAALGGRVKLLPLFVACVYGHTGALELLLDHGGDLHARHAGRTLLHAACEADRLPTAKLLLDRGIPVDVEDDHGRTPLEALFAVHPDSWAVASYGAVAELLASAGARLDGRGKSARAPRSLARRSNNAVALAWLDQSSL